MGRKMVFNEKQENPSEMVWSKDLKLRWTVHREIANGDLSLDSHDEIGRLMDGMQVMNVDLCGMEGQVMSVADQLILTVGHGEATSQETNQELNRLAAALTEMTATANELVENIRQLMATAGVSLGRLMRPTLAATGMQV